MLTATGLLYWALVSSLDRAADASLAEEAVVLKDILREHPGDESALREEVVWEPQVRSVAPMLIRLLDRRGRTLMETEGMSDGLPPGAFPPIDPVSGGLSNCVNVPAKDGAVFRVMTARVTGGAETAEGAEGPGAPPAPGAAPGRRDGPAVYEAQLALGYWSREKLLARYRRRLWVVLGGGLVVCAGVGHLIARRGIRPVTRVADAMRHITPTTLHERIDPAGFPSELTDLAGTLNRMLDRLHEAFARLTRFSADIAHELRTPISVLRGEAEVALSKSRTHEQYREVLGSLLEECGRLARLIDRLLFLARAENPQSQVLREPVDVLGELAGIREFYEIVAHERGIRLALDDAGPAAGPARAGAPGDAPAGGDGGLTASLDRALFQRAVGNLVENALAHTPEGGHVRLAAARDDGAVRVSVTDDGCGIPPEHLPFVFDRFRRVDDSRSARTGGAGLGLAIVRTIASLHGGKVEIESEVGVGTRVALHFPAPPVPPG